MKKILFSALIITLTTGLLWATTKTAPGEPFWKFEIARWEDQPLGLAFDGTYLWMSGSGSGTGANYIYKFDLNGNLVASFKQPGVPVSWGFRDLAFDGTHLYGSVDDDIVVFDTLGNLVRTFSGPLGPNRALAWDPDSFWLWVTDWSSDIYAIDATGGVIANYGNPRDIYGLAWDPDPSGPYLWATAYEGENFNYIYQLDPRDNCNVLDSFPGYGNIAGGCAFIPPNTVVEVEQANNIIWGIKAYAFANEPGAPVSLTAYSDTTMREAIELEFDEPDTNVDGTSLTNLVYLRIYRDDVLIDSIAATGVTGGGHQVYTDSGLTFLAHHIYSVSAVNNLGYEGASSEEAFSFIGANVIYSEDFDSTDGGFTSIPSGYGWEWGEPTYGPSSAYSDSFCWGTDLGSDYFDCVSWKLTSPYIDLSSYDYAKVAFYHWYEFEWLNDGSNLKISTDNGSSWDILVPYGGYPLESVKNTNFGIGDEPAYSDTVCEWDIAVFNLSNCTGYDSVLIRWHLGSDFENTYAGWYIDDVVIAIGKELVKIEEERVSRESGINYLFQNYPNPFSASTVISYTLAGTGSLSEPNHTTLKIYDASGRLVKTLMNRDEKSGYYTVRWDGRDDSGHKAANGIYFYTLENGDYSAVKKIIMLK